MVKKEKKIRLSAKDIKILYEELKKAGAMITVANLSKAFPICMSICIFLVDLPDVPKGKSIKSCPVVAFGVNCPYLELWELCEKYKNVQEKEE